MYEKKGAKDECDSSRGILLSDHSGKALCDQLASSLKPTYTRNKPKTNTGL